MTLVKGRVVEKYTRKPVQNASVNLNGYTALTNANGNFSLQTPTGIFTLRITHPDFHTYLRPLNVRANTQMGAIQMDSVIRAL